MPTTPAGHTWALRHSTSKRPVTLTAHHCLTAGDYWELRNPTDFFGTPLQKGIFGGTNITFALDSDWLAGVLVRVPSNTYKKTRMNQALMFATRKPRWGHLGDEDGNFLVDENGDYLFGEYR